MTLLVSGGAGLAALPVGAATRPSSNAAAASPLKSGKAFYKGKTITFVTPGKPGGGYDSWSRLMAPYLAAYLHATINIENVPSSEVAAQDDTASAPANGLTIGMMQPPTDALTAISNTAGVNFNAARVDFIGATGADDNVWVTRPASKLPNWKAVINSPMVVVLSAIPNLSCPGCLTYLADDIFGLKTRFINGYGSTASEVQGFVRGDGDIAMLPLSSVGPLIQAGQAIPVAQSGNSPAGNPFYGVMKKVPLISTLAKEFPPKTKSKAVLASRQKEVAAFNIFQALTTKAIFAPTKTAPNKIAALRAAFQFAMQNKGLRAQAIQEGLTPGYLSGFDVKQQYLQSVTLGKTVLDVFRRAGFNIA